MTGWLVVALIIALIAELILGIVRDIRDENQPHDQR